MADEGAFERLVVARSAALLRTAYLLTGERALAEDLLQASLARTHLHWERLREESAGEAYVRKVMTSLSVQWWRRRWRGEVPTAVLPDAPGPDVYGRADDRQVLMSALQVLTRRQRAVVVLRFLEDRSEAEVAAMLGIAVGTVKSTTAHALVRLRAALGEEWAEPVQS